MSAKRNFNLEAFLDRSCNPATKVAFSGTKSTDPGLRRHAERIAQAVEAGHFDAITADMTDEERRIATGYLPGEEVPEGPRYCLIPCFIRVSESLEGKARPGSVDPLAAILGDYASDDPFG